MEIFGDNLLVLVVLNLTLESPVAEASSVPTCNFFRCSFPKAMSISRSELFRKKKRKEGTENEKNHRRS